MIDSNCDCRDPLCPPNGTQKDVTEGRARSRIVVLEFPSYHAARACYRSPAYQAAKKLREGKAEADLVIVEGYDGAKF
jgi:uncharacterized protein (DUF1330 family)